MTETASHPWSIFLRFLLLGCVSFGGPAAHIGYFRERFVEREKWLDDAAYGRLVALSQFLPGPGSSQVGFALGYRRAGIAGALAAFLGFTLPSFVLLFVLAAIHSPGLDHPAVGAVVGGLKLLAVVVVADAVWGMAGSFCRSRLHWGLACGSAALLLVAPGLGMQLAVLAGSGLVGAATAGTAGGGAVAPIRINGRIAGLFVVAAIVAALPAGGMIHAIYSAFFRAGALVFGGGHVVLPLLQETVGGAISTDRFLTGYAAAQAVPGPMFTLAAFLGADLMPQLPLLGALVATLALFLPGLLLVLALYDGWEALAARPGVAALVAGINAAVVGLLLAALFSPVFVAAVHGAPDMAWVVLGLFALRGLRWHVGVLMPLMVGAAVLRWWW